jgi:hypothetical protein
MKRKPLLKDADALVELAESIAAVLSERRDVLGIGPDVESLLRASTSAATFAIDTYLAVLSGAQKSMEARRHLATAKSRCHRKIELLRRRVERSIGVLRRHMNGHEIKVTTRVVSISA